MDKPHGHLSTSHNNSYGCHPLTTSLEQYKKQMITFEFCTFNIFKSFENLPKGNIDMCA